MSRFSEMAKAETTLSEVMNGRNKVGVDDIIRNYPNGVTLIEVDMLHTTDKKGNPVEYPVCAIAEDNNVCFFGGTILKKIIANWIADCGGDVRACNEELKRDGGVKIKMSNSKTQNGNNITLVEVL